MKKEEQNSKGWVRNESHIPNKKFVSSPILCDWYRVSHIRHVALIRRDRDSARKELKARNTSTKGHE